MVIAWWTFLLPLLELPTWKALGCGVSAVQPWTPRVTGGTCWGPFPQPADPVILQPQDLKAVTVLSPPDVPSVRVSRTTGLSR